MKVSIITVVKNAEKTIFKCIESIVKQTYPNIEHIIIDGLSSDNTIKIITDFKDVNQKQIILLSEPDIGIYDAINKGILLSTGEIIAILHSDDFFPTTNIIEKIVGNFRSNQVDILFAKVSFISPNTKRIVRVYHSSFFKPWMFRFGFSPAHPSFYAKKKLFTRFGLYRTEYHIAGDFELMMRFLYLHKISYKYINECWVIMLLGGTSTSGFKSLFKINMEILNACKINDIYSNYLFIYSKYLFKWWGFIRK